MVTTSYNSPLKSTQVLVEQPPSNEQSHRLMNVVRFQTSVHCPGRKDESPRWRFPALSGRVTEYTGTGYQDCFERSCHRRLTEYTGTKVVLSGRITDVSQNTRAAKVVLSGRVTHLLTEETGYQSCLELLCHTPTLTEETGYQRCGEWFCH